MFGALSLDLTPETMSTLREWTPIVIGALAASLIVVPFGRLINTLLGRSFHLFNRWFDITTGAYTRAVAGLLRVSLVMVAVYGGLLGLTWWTFTRTPNGFIPQQDKGYLLVNVQLPDAASVTRTNEVVQQIEEIALQTPGVKHSVAI